MALLRRTACFELADGREVRVRSATPADARMLRRLLDEVGSETEVSILHEPGSRTVRSIRGQISAAAAEPGTLMLCASSAGQLLGHLALAAEREPASSHVCHLGLVVRSADRGLGVGSALLDVALPWAARHGIAKIAVGVMAHNRRALRFFVGHGFRREGVRVAQFRRDGRLFDEVLLARDLAESNRDAAASGPRSW